MNARQLDIHIRLLVNDDVSKEKLLRYFEALLSQREPSEIIDLEYINVKEVE